LGSLILDLVGSSVRALSKVTFDQKRDRFIHASSSVGARPSSAAPVEENQHPFTHERSAPSHKSPLTRKVLLSASAAGQRLAIRLSLAGFYSTGAAEDGRGPTEERSCVKGCWF
jgi:hypothetical protein